MDVYLETADPSLEASSMQVTFSQEYDSHTLMFYNDAEDLICYISMDRKSIDEFIVALQRSRRN
jgi:hypothetical protein